MKSYDAELVALRARLDVVQEEVVRLEHRVARLLSWDSPRRNPRRRDVAASLLLANVAALGALSSLLSGDATARALAARNASLVANELTRRIDARDAQTSRRTSRREQSRRRRA